MSAGAGIAGATLTWIFLPDTTGLDLGEIDRMHRFMLAGQVRGRCHCRCQCRCHCRCCTVCSKGWHGAWDGHGLGSHSRVGVSGARGFVTRCCIALHECWPACRPPLSCLQRHNYTGPAIKPRHLSLYERWAGYGELCCIAERSMFSAMMQMLQYAIP